MQNILKVTQSLQSGSLEDKLDYLFSSLYINLCCEKKYLTCINLYPSIGDLDYRRLPKGNLKRNGCLIQLDDQDNFQFK